MHKIATKLMCKTIDVIIYRLIIHSNHTILQLYNLGMKHCHLWDLKNSEILEIRKIKYWKPDNCKICKAYIKGLGYLQSYSILHLVLFLKKPSLQIIRVLFLSFLSIISYWVCLY